MLRTKDRLIYVHENYGFDLPQGMHAQVTVRLLTRIQLPPYSQCYFIAFSE